MKNKYSPLISLPFEFHIGFVVIAAVLLILYYIVAKKRHTFVLLLAILTSLLIYFVEQGTSFYMLCITEWILAALYVIAYIRDYIDEKNAEKKRPIGTHDKKAKADEPEESDESAENTEKADITEESFDLDEIEKTLKNGEHEQNEDSDT